MSKKKLRLFKWLFYGLAYASLFTPILVLMIVNWNVYFVKNKSAFEVAMGGIIAFVYVFALVKVGFKNFNQVLSAGVLVVVVYLLQTIIQDAFLITLMYFIGVCCFKALEIPAKYFGGRLHSYVDETDRERARQEIRNEIKPNGR